MNKIVLSLAGLLLACSANAGVLNLVEGKDSCDGRAVPVSATATLADRQVALTTVGAGLRTYSVFKVKIYCFQVLASDATKYVKTADGALPSLAAMETVTLRLDFVYNVSNAQLKKAYVDGFNANGVDTSSPSVAAFMNAAVAAGDVTNGQTITITMDLKTGTIYYEDQNGKVTPIQNVDNANEGIISIWLGKTADSGLADLKKQLLE